MIRRLPQWCLLGLLAHGAVALAQDARISGAELISGQASEVLASMAAKANELDGPLTVVGPKRWHGMIGKQLAGQLDPKQIRFQDGDGQSIAFYLKPPGTSAVSSSAPAPLAPDAPKAVGPSASAASQALRDTARAQVENLQPQIMGADELLGRSSLTPDFGQPPAAAAPEAAPAGPATSVSAEPVSAESAPAPPLVAEPAVQHSFAAVESNAAASAPDASEPKPEAVESAAAPLAEEPADDPSEKARMEARYNDGGVIDRQISVAALRPDDMLYEGSGRVLIARRKRTGIQFYWLSESMDLSRKELEKTGNGRYRVLRRVR